MPAPPVNTATRSPKPIIECQQCGTAHEQRRIGSIYCSKACATKASSIRRAEYRREAAKKWRQENAERAHSTAKRYRQANKDKEAARQRRWRATPNGNEAYKAAIRKWRVNNPEKVEKKRLRRTIAELEGNATPARIEAKWKASDKTCCLCGCVIDRNIASPDPLSFTIEHLTPICRGGKHDIDNIAFAHRGCNSSKKGKTIEEYRMRAVVAS